MENFLKQGKLDLKTFRSGEVISGTVLRKSKDELFLDIGSKSEGLVSGSELKDGLGTFEGLSVGDSVLARVAQGRGKKGMITLSLKGASGEKKWRKLSRMFEDQEVFESVVLDCNSGGLVVETLEGVEGFLPLSHLDWAHFPLKEKHQAGGGVRGKEAILSRLVGKRILVKVIELEPQNQRVVVSEKEAISETQQVKGEQLWSTLESGVGKEGVVTGIVPFGLFVRLENTNVEGLVHISEISWGKVSHPSDIYEIGDEVKVKVLSSDSKREKVSLSIKALEPNPWEVVKGRYAEGETVSGEVTRITPFGAFIKVAEGVEGLIHISETEGPLEVGETIRARIVTFEPEKHRLGLSVRQIDE